MNFRFDTRRAASRTSIPTTTAGRHWPTLALLAAAACLAVVASGLAGCAEAPTGAQHASLSIDGMCDTNTNYAMTGAVGGATQRQLQECKDQARREVRRLAAQPVPAQVAAAAP